MRPDANNQRENKMSVSVSTNLGYGIATTDHPASSYGLPVVVIDGDACGPAETGPVNIPCYGPEDTELVAMHQALEAAGYEVYA